MRRSRLAFAVSLLLNLLFLIVLHLGTRPHGPLSAVRNDSALQVRLIESAPVALPDEPVPPSPRAPRVVPPKSQAHRRARADTLAPTLADERQAVEDGDAENTDRSAQLRLFDMDGRLRLPETTSGDVAAATPFPARPRALLNGDPFARRNTVLYEPTRFESVWAPRDETLGGEILRKLTVERSWLTPWGTQVNCTWILILGGCSWGSAPSATIEELKAMRADPPILKHPYVEPVQGQ